MCIIKSLTSFFLKNDWLCGLCQSSQLEQSQSILVSLYMPDPKNFGSYLEITPAILPIFYRNAETTKPTTPANAKLLYRLMFEAIALAPLPGVKA